MKKMIPEIRDISVWTEEGTYSSEKMRQYKPDDIYNMAIRVDLTIGEKKKKGTNYFYALFVTAGYISEINEKSRRRMIIIPYYDWDLILDEINEIVFKEDYYSWTDFCTSMTKYFKWEYENYKH